MYFVVGNINGFRNVFRITVLGQTLNKGSLPDKYPVIIYIDRGHFYHYHRHCMRNMYYMCCSVLVRLSFYACRALFDMRIEANLTTRW